MNLKNRLLNGIGWRLIGSVSGQLMSFIAVIVTARLLGNENYGMFSLVQSTVVMFSSVAGAGLGVTATKFIAEYKGMPKYKDKLNKILGLSHITANVVSVLLTLIMIFFSRYIALEIFKEEILITQLLYASVYVYFFTINGFQVGILTGLEKFDDVSKIGILKGLFSLAFLSLFIYLWGLNGAAIAIVITSAISFFYSKHLVVKAMRNSDIQFTYKNTLEEKGVLWIFTFPAALIGVIGGVATWLANQFLVNYSTDRFISLSLFNLASNLKIIMTFLPMVVLGVTSPILVNLKNKDYKLYKRLFKLNILLNGSLTIIFSLMVIFCIPLILKLVGDGYSDITSVIIIIGLSAIVETISTCIYQEIFINNKIWTNFLSTIIWALILISTTFFFSAKYGALAIAMGYLLANIFQNIFYIIVYYKIRNKNNKIIEDINNEI